MSNIERKIHNYDEYIDSLNPEPDETEEQEMNLNL